MYNTFKMVLIFKDNYFQITNFTSFYFVKDRYIPYTYASGKFISNEDYTEITNCFDVRCYIDDKLIHQGLVDFLEKEFVDGRWVYSFQSRGYSLLLGQNQPVPKMNYDVNLTSLAQVNTDIPEVTYQENTDNVNYIYVKENSTIWDALCAYSTKAYNTIPYISKTNTVRVTYESLKEQDYSNILLITTGKTVNTKNMLSDVFMADASGEYTFNKTNSSSTTRNIVRKKYYSLDKQWLNSPDNGLVAKLNFSNRNSEQAFFTYIGYNDEELFDSIVDESNPLAMTNSKIHKFEITIKDRTIFTTVYSFLDGN